jgi:hypothetical protein
MSYQPDQQRIMQLTSSYSPSQSPQLPLTFGDYLSLLWRIDLSANNPKREAYYRQCANALAQGLGFENRSLFRFVQRNEAGSICSLLQNSPYQGTGRLVDAQDRRAAIWQLMDLRDHILAMGAYREQWNVGWPGSRLTSVELRERLFAVFFTAFEGQFRHFSRLLLVVDIVLQELLLGDRQEREISLIRLIQGFGYPDPDSGSTRAQFASPNS